MAVRHCAFLCFDLITIGGIHYYHTTGTLVKK